MKKLNFGAGLNALNGWENYDLYPLNSSIKYIDIGESLPFENDFADFIFAEHVFEHISQYQGYLFLKESKRILKKGGVLRIATPNLIKICETRNENYEQFIRSHGWGENSVEAILSQHGHLCVWNPTALLAVLNYLGFSAKEVAPHESEYKELQNIEGHHRVIGNEFNLIETFCVEAIK